MGDSTATTGDEDNHWASRAHGVRAWTQNVGWLDWRLCPGALLGERS